MVSAARDSAGVAIVEQSRPQRPEGLGWRLSEEPTLTIGTIDGDPDHELSRVTGAVRLSDGTIVVANTGTYELKFFDPSGRHLRNVGREGDGPGEFRFPASLWRSSGDTLHVWDPLQKRLSVFGSGGQLVRTVRLSSAGGGGGNVSGIFEDQSMLVVRGGRRLDASVSQTVLRDSVRLDRYERSGEFADSLMRLPSGNKWVLTAGGRTTFPDVPFTPEPTWTTDGLDFYAGSASAFAIEQRDTTGKLLRSIRVLDSERPLTEELRDEYGENLLAFYSRSPEQQRRQETFLAEVPFPDRLPAYSRLLVDDVGYLWVEEYRIPMSPQSVWQVFDSSGTWLGRWDAPRGLRVFQFGRDFVIGVRRDEFDVEYVELYALDRTAEQ